MTHYEKIMQQRTKDWNKLPKENRLLIIAGVFESLVEIEDVSLEQGIQRIIDTFGCEHQEVIEALKTLR